MKFSRLSPEKVLCQSLHLLDRDSITEIRSFVADRQASSGGFKDKAGKADLYYTLFGYFTAEAMGLTDLFPSASHFVETEIRRNRLSGVHMHCASILSAKTGLANLDGAITRNIRKNIRMQLSQPAYNAFLNLLTCYYIQDYSGLYRAGRQIESHRQQKSLPGPVIAALLVFLQSFGKNTDELIRELFELYDGQGGFRATVSAPVPDLLSTAVALYALRFAGADLRRIAPDCLCFVDSMYSKGGFSATVLDDDTDIEYTFYGLLALGALAENHEPR